MRQQQHQRGGRHAIETRRLAEAGGPVALELLADLVGEAWQGGECEAGRNGDGLVLAEGGDVQLLPCDVDRVARVRGELAGDGSIEGADLGPDLHKAVSYTHLRAHETRPD